MVELGPRSGVHSNWGCRTETIEKALYPLPRAINSEWGYKVIQGIEKKYNQYYKNTRL